MTDVAVPTVGVRQATVDPAALARRRYFPAVEGSRGAAALAVLLGHFLAFSHPLGGVWTVTGSWLARFGVVLFFGISGFLLYRPFVATRHSERSATELIPSFLWRRAARILPGYWVALTLLTIWPGMPEVFSPNFWHYYGLVQIYHLRWEEVGGLPTAWTLCVELSFYLVLPVLAIFLATRGAGTARRSGIRWEVGFLGLLAGASIVVFGLTIVSHSALFITGTLLGTFSWFASGMVLAVLQIEHPTSARGAAKMLSNPFICWPLGIAVFALVPLELLARLHVGVGASEAVQTLLLGVAAALLLAPAMLGDTRAAVRWVLANRLIVYFGTISYGIYLYHYPLLRWVLEAHLVVTSSHPLLTAGVVLFAMVVAAATTSWYLVERPIMRLARSGIAISGARRRLRAAPPA
jgi:peptidoglycan/LPS O-acetylase OafA/YrhL